MPYVTVGKKYNFKRKQQIKKLIEGTVTGIMCAAFVLFTCYCLFARG